MKKTKTLINTITDWEAWPFKLIYTPMSIFWLWYIIRSGAIWFFTPSNPKLTFGGMEGEPKKEMYDLLPPTFYPATFNVLPNEDFLVLKQKLSAHKIDYPFIVKPEVGGQGILLRKIDDEAALKRYHGLMPWEYIVQKMVHYPMEVSVFYIRHPKQTKGTVTGFLHKIPLQVTGDGKQTLASLIGRHPKAGKKLDELFNKHRERWDEVLAPGEKYMLSYAANHNRGAQFIDLKHQIDDRLVEIFDKISLQINDFFYGRYDIMCANVNDLKMGKNFTILEYNGCGAEPNHFYDTGYTLMGAYKEILKHWKALYEISKYNSTHVLKPWPFVKGSKFLKSARNHIRDMKKIDAEMG
ncbi:MAG: hypothetical protein H7Z13_07140 [Ferruginibacter sp.]|nr:hypothetical protein [Ferruginibacter sp.]